MEWDLSAEFMNDWDKIDNDVAIAAWDPWNNQPLVFDYEFSEPGRVTMAFTPIYNVKAHCDPPQFCMLQGEYQAAGSHRYRWAGVDTQGEYRGEVRWIGVNSERTTWPKSVVLLHGTLPVVSDLAVAPLTWSPYSGDQSVTFNVGSYQSEALDVEVSFMNLESKSVLREIVMTGLPVGQVSVAWDGRADNGALVAPGSYVVTVRATTSHGVASAQVLTRVEY